MESDSYDRPMPDFTQLLMQKIAAQKTAESKPPMSGFDPHKMFVKKKEIEDGKPIDTSDVIKWPEEDVKKLEDFCKKYGIIGFSCGRMSPLAALQMLKDRFGIDDRPLEDRVPSGYEKLGSNMKKNPHFPYEQIVTKKTLLNG